MGTKIDTSKPGYRIDKPIQLKELASITSLADYGTLWFRNSDHQLMVTLSTGATLPISSPQGPDWQNSVLDRYDPTGGLPGASTGDRYIATATANGWTINRIYQYSGTGWDETIPNEGYAALVEDENLWYLYNGASWVLWGSVLSTGTAPENVTKSTAQAGSSSELARRDHKHDISTATPAAQVPGDTALESVGGTTTTLARSDHRHSLPAFGAVAGTFCQGDDARLSDARVPLSHAASHNGGGDPVTPGGIGAEPAIGAKGTAFNKNFGTTAGTVCEGNDSRLSSGSAFPVDTARYGFTNRGETYIYFDGVDKFYVADRIAPWTWSYYRNGVKYTISGIKNVTVASPMVDGTLYYIFIDAVDGTLTSSTSPWTLNDTKVPVATLYWDSTLTPKYLLADERHTCLIDRRMHRYEHFSEGTRLLSGGTMSGLTPGSDLDSAKTFGLTATDIADEDIFLNITALTDPEGLSAAYYNLYRTSPTKWVWATSDMPFKYANLGGGTYGYIEYDNGSGVSTQASNNNFVNTYVVVSNAVANSEVDPDKSTAGLRYFIVQGRGAFSSAALAASENFGSFNLTGFPVNEAVAIYQITWATTNRPNTVKGRCRYVSTQKVTENIITTSAVAIVNHNTLAGLQGGSAGEYYHLTSAQHAALTKMYGAMAIDIGGAVSQTIDNTDVWHAYVGLVTGPVSGISFVAGEKHTDITAYATYNAGAETKVSTTGAHNLAVGDIITISGTTNYNNIYQVVQIVGANDFTIDKAWDGNDDAAGTFRRGDCLKIPVGGAGDYMVSYTASGVVSGSSDVCDFCIALNKVPKRISYEMMPSGEPTTFCGSAIITASDGDVFWFGVYNEDSTNDIGIGSMSFAIHRL